MDHSSIPLQSKEQQGCISRPSHCHCCSCYHTFPNYYFHRYPYSPFPCSRFSSLNHNNNPPASPIKPLHPPPFLHHHQPQPLFGCPSFHYLPPCRPVLFPPIACLHSKHNQEQHYSSISMAVPEAKQTMGVVISEPNGLEEVVDGDVENEEVEEDEPVFVLTDEWMEFFTKSEAKRKQDKKLKQRKGSKK